MLQLLRSTIPLRIWEFFILRPDFPGHRIVDRAQGTDALANLHLPEPGSDLELHQLRYEGWASGLRGLSQEGSGVLEKMKRLIAGQDQQRSFTSRIESPFLELTADARNRLFLFLRGEKNILSPKTITSQCLRER